MKRVKKSPRRVWLGRPAEDYYRDSIELSDVKSGWSESVGFDDPVAEFCVGDFTRVTGILLEPGELRRVRIHVEVLDEAKTT